MTNEPNEDATPNAGTPAPRQHQSQRTPAASRQRGPSPTADAAALAAKLTANLSRVIFGKERLLRHTVAALFADGHVLIEDVPGTGKTVLARALARSLRADFARVQFTPDLLPSDVTGISIYNEATREFEFRAGPVFTQILLADELNRTTPRTQAALLECMAERTVTADGTTRALDDLFFVIATQNPLEQHGVYVLPEAQLDRFLVRLTVGYPGAAEEMRMLESQRGGHPLTELEPVASRDDVLAARAAIRDVYVDPDVAAYIVRLVEATRKHEEVLLGGSPRASLALEGMARALAAIDGARFVLPDHVKEAFLPVLRHRLILRPQARISGVSPDALLTDLLRTVSVPVGI